MKESLEDKIVKAKQYIKDNYKDKFIFIRGFYKDKRSKKRKTPQMEFFIEVECLTCHQKFSRRFCDFKRNDRCFRCVQHSQVSFLHNRICLMAQRYYPLAEVEKDIGFKGDKGKPSRYDLFIPNHKTYGDVVIEFQSRFHDYKKDFDERKKHFAENNGFTFLAFDERTVDIDEVSLLLFEKVVDADIKNVVCKPSFDIIKCQEYLDMFLPLKEIAKIMNVFPCIIQNNLTKGVLYYSPERRRALYNEQPIVCINNNEVLFFDKMSKTIELFNFEIKRPPEDGVLHSHGMIFMRREYYDNYFKFNPIV